MKGNPGQEKDLSLRAETSETAAENGRIQDPSPPTVEKVKSLLVFSQSLRGEFAEMKAKAAEVTLIRVTNTQEERMKMGDRACREALWAAVCDEIGQDIDVNPINHNSMAFIIDGNVYTPTNRGSTMYSEPCVRLVFTNKNASEYIHATGFIVIPPNER